VARITVRSNYAMLDVTDQRKSLRKHLEQGKGPLPVVIKGFITRVHGADDGTSQEFTVDVRDVEVTFEDPDPTRSLNLPKNGKMWLGE
jgi:hypothetical protein